MLALQLLTTIPKPEIQTWYYIFMTALADSGHVPQNNFPFNNFRSTDFTLTSKHSVESRMLCPNCVIA